MDSKNLIAQIIGEARNYERFSDIEKLVECGDKLENIPLQPLHGLLKSSPTDLVASVLPKLSADQRQALIDIDFWKRDVVDVQGFEYWLQCYCQSKDDELVSEFVESDDFLLYLKSRVNIWTFDVEDPEYPEHDYYFLTDDGLLLVEYSEKYPFVSELKYLIGVLYSHLGVENAYSKLFKLINDNFSILQEDSYQEKLERQREFGFVDYFEAKEKLFPMATEGQLEKFIKNRKQTFGKITAAHLNQKLPVSALVAFEQDSNGIISELAKVVDDKLFAYLSFSFVRTINATLVIEDAFGSSSVDQLRIGKQTRILLELGIEQIKKTKNLEGESVFAYFDFMEVYKVGCSLIEFARKRVKNALKGSLFENSANEYFLGSWWEQFLENTFAELPMARSFGVRLHPCPINNLEIYNFWSQQVDQFIKSLPFVEKFYRTLDELKKTGKIQSGYYLNFNIEEINFESILISALINFDLKKSEQSKLAVSIDEMRMFLKKYFNTNQDEYTLKNIEDPELSKLLNDFIHAFGLSEIGQFSDYLYGIIYEQMSGYEYDTLKFEDFAHVGGPILLRALVN